jgi:hypothetical protein
MKLRLFSLLLFYVNIAFAHQPDLSNLMIYEQNGKKVLVLKSSLTAFEGEVNFHFKKGAFKSPEEFAALAIKHFTDHCFVIINGDSVKLINPRVILGHETTIFALLGTMPNEIESVYLKNTFFKDIHNNQCEFILSLKDKPQYQYILNNDNKLEVELAFENNKWVVIENKGSLLKSLYVIIGGVLLLIIGLVVFKRLKKNNAS